MSDAPKKPQPDHADDDVKGSPAAPGLTGSSLGEADREPDDDSEHRMVDEGGPSAGGGEEADTPRPGTTKKETA